MKKWGTAGNPLHFYGEERVNLKKNDPELSKWYEKQTLIDKIFKGYGTLKDKQRLREL